MLWIRNNFADPDPPKTNRSGSTTLDSFTHPERTALVLQNLNFIVFTNFLANFFVLIWIPNPSPMTKPTDFLSYPDPQHFINVYEYRTT
jgi:hypothetical protein